MSTPDPRIDALLGEGKLYYSAQLDRYSFGSPLAWLEADTVSKVLDICEWGECPPPHGMGVAVLWKLIQALRSLDARLMSLETGL